MSRQPIATEKRKPLSRAAFGQLMIDQAGKCACGCGEKLQPLTEGVIDEHLNPLALTGTNDLDNRAIYRKPCARRKTDQLDTPRIAKAKAQGGETGQYARRQKRGFGSIQSQGFDKTRTKKFDGTVVARAQETH